MPNRTPLRRPYPVLGATMSLLLVGAVVTVVVSVVSAQPAQALASPPPRYHFNHGHYTLTDLGHLPGGSESEANGINDERQVVGYGTVPCGSTCSADHAFLWQQSVMQDLGTPMPLSEALGSNDNGQVVGDANFSSGVQHAVLWQNGLMQDLGALPGTSGDCNHSEAEGINEHGQVVGGADTASCVGRAVLWQDGTLCPLPTFPTADQGSAAIAINGQGQVAGDATISSPGGVVQHAVLWTFHWW